MLWRGYRTLVASCRQTELASAVSLWARGSATLLAGPRSIKNTSATYLNFVSCHGAANSPARMHCSHFSGLAAYTQRRPVPPRHEIRFLRQPDRRACTPSRSIGRGTHLYAYPVIVTAKRDLVSACHWLMPQLRRGVQKSRTINVASGIGHRISSTSSMPENLVHLLCPSFIFVPMQHKHESSIDVYPPQDLTALYAHSATRTCGDIGC